MTKGDLFQTIKRPLVTEKNTLQATKANQYAFEVDLRANRSQIKKAVEKLFGVKVIKVNTMVSRRDPRRMMGRFASSDRVLWKKALVTLREGDKFEFVAS